MAKQKVDTRTALAKALDFLRLTSADYCVISNGRAMANDRIVAAAIGVDEDLEACPHLETMYQAILRAGESYIISQLSPIKLLVRSEDFQAYVPCLPLADAPQATPDARQADIDNRLIDALLKVLPLVSTVAETVLERSVQLNSGMCQATDRHIILQAWHGLDLPNGLLLPKHGIQAINGADKDLVGFGYSGNTATIYFDDSSWIRTQLFQEKWPEVISSIFSKSAFFRPREVPAQLFESAAKVAVFSVDEKVYIKDEHISSHPFDAKEEGGSLNLPIGSYHAERIYNFADLKKIKKHAELWDEKAAPTATYFQGDSIRGMVTHEIPASEDDDIPF